MQLQATSFAFRISLATVAALSFAACGSEHTSLDSLSTVGNLSGPPDASLSCDKVAISTGDHVPNPTDRYLPDCNLDAREYYRTFVKEDGTAYLFPRPDSNDSLRTACDATHEDALRPTLERYDLCQATALGAEQVAAVNAMTPDDALNIARFLNQALVFTATDTGVTPHAFNGDIVELCSSNANFRSGVAPLCDVELLTDGGPRADIARPMNREQAEVTADALNTLYGLSSAQTCERLEQSAVAKAAPELSTAVFGVCETDSDCIVAPRLSCDLGCSAPTISVFQLESLMGAQTAIEQQECADHERLGCGAMIVCPAIAPTLPSCKAGRCNLLPGEPPPPQLPPSPSPNRPGVSAVRCQQQADCSAGLECLQVISGEFGHCSRSCDITPMQCDGFDSQCVQNVPRFDGGEPADLCLRSCETQEDCASTGTECAVIEGAQGTYCR